MALFLGAGRLVLNGFQQQVSDLAFRDDCELVLSPASRVTVERIQRLNGDARVVDCLAVDNVVIRDVRGGVRIQVGEDVKLSDIEGDVTLSTLTNMQVGLVHGALDATNCTNLRALSVCGTVDLHGGTNLRIAVEANGHAYGLSVDAAPTNVVAEVNVVDVDGHGVEIDGGTDISISGVVSRSGQGMGTFDNVHITGAAAGIRVSELRSRGGGTARAGVFIDEDCTDCIVDGVDFGAAADYGTDDLVDNGTNTRIGTNWSL